MFAYIAIVTDLLVIYAAWSLISIINGDATGGFDESDAATNTRNVALAFGVWLLVFIASFISFLVWFHRAHKNLGLGGLIGMKYGSGWAIGGFFVPFLNFVRPYSVMKEVSMGSAYLARRVDEETDLEEEPDEIDGDVRWIAAEPEPIVQYWWACWVAQYVLNFASPRLRSSDDVSYATTALWFLMARVAIAIPMQLCAIKLIRTISAQQETAREAQLARAGGL